MSESDGLVSLFSAAQVRRLTELSAHQLAYWDETDFFRPAHAGDPGERFGRVYSFEDLVGLRVIAIMRSQVPLQELRRVGEWLLSHRGSWAGRRFWIGGRRVFWDDEDGLRIGTGQPNQAEIPIEMDAITEDMRSAIAKLRKRAPDQVGKLEQRRFTVGHKMLIAGTRIPTRVVWELHRAGYDDAAIRREFPRLTNRDIEAALEWEEGRRAS